MLYRKHRNFVDCCYKSVIILDSVSYQSNARSTTVIQDAVEPSLTSLPAAVNAKLLVCFIVDRSQIQVVDDLVKICSDFHTAEKTCCFAWCN